MYKVAYLCEPPPEPDSVTVANMLIQSIPSVANVKDPAEQKKLVRLAYRLSRALIGDRLAYKPPSLARGGLTKRNRNVRINTGTPTRSR